MSRGLAEQAIVSGQCGSCHGEQGLGTGTQPRIAGQGVDYLERTMTEFRTRQRNNNPWMSDLMASLQPEDVDGWEDGDGCPDMGQGQGGAAPALEKRLVLRSVHFMGNSPELLPESYVALDSLAGVIKANAGVMVEVRGYWDAAGSELEGMRASEARANAVRKYLVAKGVAPDQILARGLGARDPIETNRTAAGRQRNRRVELVRLN